MTNQADGYPRKRARTRAQIRRACLGVLAAKGPAAATISEIAGRAEISPGTVYNHYASLGDLLVELEEELGTSIEISGDAMKAIGADPATRVAIGVLQLLALADSDNDAGAAFVALVAARPEFRSRIRHIVGRAISDGVGSGQFTPPNQDAAINAVLGASLQSMRSVILGEIQLTAATSAAVLVLRSLGLALDEASRHVEQAGELFQTPSVTA